MIKLLNLFNNKKTKKEFKDDREINISPSKEINIFARSGDESFWWMENNNFSRCWSLNPYSPVNFATEEEAINLLKGLSQNHAKWLISSGNIVFYVKKTIVNRGKNGNEIEESILAKKSFKVKDDFEDKLEQAPEIN